MDPETRRALTTEIQRHLRDGTNPLCDAVWRQPVSDYTEAGRLARERERLFRAQPIVVGHASQLPTPGRFLTAEVAGLPLLVVRGRDGTLRAFVNLCRHRGARVVEARCGEARFFRCPYHGWTYGRDGALRAIPESEAFADVDPAERGLLPLPVEARHGFVWVVATPGAKIDVAAHLGTLDAELAAYGLDGYVEERRTDLHEALNWKLVVDGFLEVYHLPSLHPTTAGKLIHGRPAPFEAFGPHGRLVAVRKSFDPLIDDDPADVDLLPHLAIVYQLFPNTVLIWQGDHFEVWSMQPEADDPARSVSAVRLLAPSAEDAAAREEHWEKNWRLLLDTVEQEDFRVSRTMQAGFASGAQSHVLFGRNEPALQHFHRVLREALGAA